MKDVKYFEDYDGAWIYAGIGALAIEGLLRVHTPVTSKSDWEWLDRSTTAWDAAHQKIYRNFRVTRMEAGEIETLPPLPDGPPPDVAAPVAHVFNTAKYPALASMLRASATAAVELHVVLSEDTYESSCGDGEFHDFSAIRLSEKAAHEYVDAAPTYFEAYYHRTLSLSLEGEIIRYDLQKEDFDTCDVGRMLDAAESLAESRHDARSA